MEKKDEAKTERRKLLSKKTGSRKKGDRGGGK